MLMFILVSSTKYVCYLKEVTLAFSFISSHNILFFEILIKMLCGSLSWCYLNTQSVKFSIKKKMWSLNQKVIHFLLREGEAVILVLENMLRKNLLFSLRNNLIFTNGGN